MFCTDWGLLLILLLKNFPQLVVFHTVKSFSIVSEEEVDVFLEFSCFFCDPMDVGNLISGSSAFSKSPVFFWPQAINKQCLWLDWHLEFLL